MMRSPELQAVHDLDAAVVHEQVVQIIAELRAIGEAKDAAASRSYHRPLPDVTMSREQLTLAYEQAKRKPAERPA
jgi:hypothetical protein